MNSFASIAAVVNAAANRNASEGILNNNNNNTHSQTNNKRFVCTHSHANETSSLNDADLIKKLLISNDNNNNAHHQIGTNLFDLTVCWHKVDMSDVCDNCGHPFYEGKHLLFVLANKTFYAEK